MDEMDGMGGMGWDGMDGMDGMGWMGWMGWMDGTDGMGWDGRMGTDAGSGVYLYNMYMHVKKQKTYMSSAPRRDVWRRVLPFVLTLQKMHQHLKMYTCCTFLYPNHPLFVHWACFLFEHYLYMFWHYFCWYQMTHKR